MSREAVWEQARHVLCVRLDALGDVLMTTPALRALRESAPGRRITLLTSPSGAAPGPMLPEVDEYMIYESPWMKSSPPGADGRADREMIERLRLRRFDAAVIFTVFSQNPLPAALMCHLADIPLRLAYCRENPYHLLTDRVAEPEPEQFVRHEVRRQLDLVASVGSRPSHERLSLRVPDDARCRVAGLLARLGFGDGGPWIVIHPGATAPSRRYPPEGFAEAARSLARDHGLRVVFTGSGPEGELVKSIRSAMGVPSGSLVGELGLAELAALIERAPLLIANNTGPVHVAAAVGTPVVDLYALTNLQHTPWAVPSRVLNRAVPCGPCYKSICPEGHHDCLRLVSPGEVVRAALELLGEPAARRPPAPRHDLRRFAHVHARD
ncbi:glycosyltransferase family 9 protein [Tautonia plasticadhaerens]|uniref:ADP-heptose--LPS heptosyltransferase 2 n=1 Tax=Tautonia plasticadhaerens TaxID=2527974 RepID=A0A518H612_9BACT|nr:glycosyltransferase family 9 protein [Tautonia plasticadhaerens]QDV36271.1 ADP-heptose--LPS heptosyltransferase 2 [Tautonia plasticadhaerens]